MTCTTRWQRRQPASNGKYAGAIALEEEPINLWWDDYLHASKYGSYLAADSWTQ